MPNFYTQAEKLSAMSEMLQNNLSSYKMAKRVPMGQSTLCMWSNHIRKGRVRSFIADLQVPSELLTDGDSLAFMLKACQKKGDGYPYLLDLMTKHEVNVPSLRVMASSYPRDFKIRVENAISYLENLGNRVEAVEVDSCPPNPENPTIEETPSTLPSSESVTPFTMEQWDQVLDQVRSFSRMAEENQALRDENESLKKTLFEIREAFSSVEKSLS